MKKQITASLTLLLAASVITLLSPAARCAVPGMPLDFSVSVRTPTNSYQVFHFEWKLNPNGGIPTWFVIHMAQGNVTDPALFSKLTKVAPITRDSGLTWQTDYSYDYSAKNLQPGDYSFYMFAFNNDGNGPSTSIQSVTLQVTPTGMVFTTTPPKYGYVGREYVYDAEAKYNGLTANVRFAGINLPTGATVDSMTGVFRFTPNAIGQSGFALKAYLSTDPAVHALQQFTVKVQQDSTHTNPTACALITGQVLDNSQNPVNGKVIAYVADSLHANTNAYVAAIVNGAFSIPVGAGTYVLYFSGQGFTSEYFEDASTIQQARRITIACNDTVTIAATVAAPVLKSISGTVSDSNSNPVMAKIKVIASNSGHYSTQTQNDGSYSIQVPANVDYVVVAYPNDPAYAAQYYDHAVDYGHATHIFLDTDRTGIDFTLVKNYSVSAVLSGWVSDSAATPVQAMVTAYYMSNTNAPDPSRSVTTATDSNGYFEFRNIAYGAYYVFIHPISQDYIPGYYNQHTGRLVQTWQTATLVKISANTPQSIRMVVQKRNGFRGGAVLQGVISGPMVGFIPGDVPIGGAFVVLRDPRGNISDYVLSDNQGRYVIDEGGLGRYTASVDKIGYAEYSTPVDLNYTDKSNVSMSIVLQPQSVTGLDRPMPANATFNLYPNPSSGILVVTSSELQGSAVARIFNSLGETVYVSAVNESMNGAFTIDVSGLRTGMYFLQVSGPGFARTSAFTIMR